MGQNEGGKLLQLSMVRMDLSLEDFQHRSNRASRVAMLKNITSISINVTSVVGIVLVNKIIFSHYNFPFGTISSIYKCTKLLGIALTIAHFLVTSLILLALSWAGVFERKRLPIPAVLPLSASFCGFVVLTNLALKQNSVAFCQMMKVLTTPLVGLIQYCVYGVEMKRSVRVTLGITCIGVLAATLKEVAVSPTGSALAFASVAVTAIYQVLVGAKQKDLDANSMQLLLYQAPISAAMLIICCPFLEPVDSLVHFPYTSPLVITIILSSILAALVNVSTFLIIGQTSAITYNVVGHCKLCLVLLFGFFLFDHQSLSMLNLAGVGIALAGISTYSYIKLKPS